MIQFGAKILLPTTQLEEEWRSDKIHEWMRPAVVFTAMLYHEMGASRCRVLKIFGDEGEYRYGRAVDIAVLELPNVFKAADGCDYTEPRWIVQRLNMMLNYGDGDKQCAEYVGTHIKLTVPAAGFTRHSVPLGEWQTFGASGRVLTPRKIRV